MKKLFLICAVALSNLCFSVVPTTGLIARWEFSNNLFDGTGSNNGTWQGPGSPAYVPDRCGNPKSAISFNGVNQFIQMTTPGIAGNGARSLSFWMRTNNTAFGTGVNAPNFVKTAFNDGQYSAGGTGTRWEVNHNYECQGLGVDISSEFITRPNTCFNNGIWHHVVVTQAASSALNTVSIYLDGTLIAGNCSPTTNSGLNNTVAQAITIGALRLGNLLAPAGRFFQGALDDFYYYNVVLSPADVALLYFDNCTVTSASCFPPPQNPATTACCLGSAGCTGANPLTNNWQIPLAGNKFIFSEVTGGSGRVGIGSMLSACSPGNLLEVRKGTTNPISGLRLTDLVGATPLASSGNVLSINGSGDVILVPDQAGSGTFGGAQNGLNYNITAANKVELGGTLLHNTNIDMATFGLGFQDGLAGYTHYRNHNGATYSKATGPMPFGTPETSFYEDVIASNSSSNFGRQMFMVPASAAVSPGINGFTGNYINVNTSGFAIQGKVAGEWASSRNINGTGSNTGGVFEAVGNSAMGTNENVGVFATAGSANYNYCFYAVTQAMPVSVEDNGVRIQSQSNVGTTTNIGGRFLALQGQNVIGVYAEAAGGTVSNWAGYFKGNVQITGNLWNNTTLIFSDKRLKKDIKHLENVSEKLKKLNGYTYNFRTEEFKERGFDNKTHIGLIAQELQEAFPELVSVDKDGYYAVDYQGMVPVLVEAIKDQQKQIDELKEMIKSNANNSSTGDSKAINSSAITLSDKNTIVLNQNIPNPFAESTIITYNIPNDFTKAQLIFTTTEGKIITAFDITAKGPGKLNVFANDLSSGMYSYYLVVDGKTIDTKKMVKQ